MTTMKLSLFLALTAILTFFHNVEAAQQSSLAAAVDDHDTAATPGGGQGSNPTNKKALRGSGSTPRLLVTTPSDSSDASDSNRSLSGEDTTPLCPNAIENMFEVLMSPNNNYGKTKFHVFRLNPDLTHDRKVLAENIYYSTAPDQSTSRCLYTIFCYKLIVYNTASPDTNGGYGLYKALWNGKLLLKVN